MVNYFIPSFNKHRFSKQLLYSTWSRVQRRGVLVGECGQANSFNVVSVWKKRALGEVGSKMRLTGQVSMFNPGNGELGWECGLERALEADWITQAEARPQGAARCSAWWLVIHCAPSRVPLVGRACEQEQGPHMPGCGFWTWTCSQWRVTWRILSKRMT